MAAAQLDRKGLLMQDCERTHAQAHRDLEPLQGKRLLLTGGTGFFGTWLLECLMWANRHAGLDCQVWALSRDPDRVRARLPHLASDPHLTLFRGDVRTFAFPEGGFHSVIHAAAESGSSLNDDDPLLMVDTIIEGTRRVLDFAVITGVQRFLFVSSGAVYGRQPTSMMNVEETFCGGPNTLSPKSAYHEAKRLAELLCCIYVKKHGLAASIARCFAFVGPHLPLDIHYAIGNFIRDGLAHKPICIRGDGTPFRSYQYASDLVAWLLGILQRGGAGSAYNVGSDVAISIADLARLVAEEFDPPPTIEILKRPEPGASAERYVPSVSRATTELGLANSVDLRSAIRKTIEWHRAV